MKLLVRHHMVALRMAQTAVRYLQRVCIAGLATMISAVLAWWRIELGYI